MVHTIEESDIQADTLEDIRIDSDRQVVVGNDNDLDVTKGMENVAQSVVIGTGRVLRSLVGEPLTNETLAQVEEDVRQVLQNDPQLDDVRRVVITDIGDNSVSFDVFVGLNNSFTAEVQFE